MLGKATHRVSHMLFQPFHPKFAQKKYQKIIKRKPPCRHAYLLVSEAAILIGRSMCCGLANVVRLRPCQSSDGCCAGRCHIGTSGLAPPDPGAGGSRFLGNQIVGFVFLWEIRCYVIFHQVEWCHVTWSRFRSLQYRWNLRLTMAGKVPVLVGIPLSGLQTWESDPTCWDYPSL